jgi:hypothetical protein
MARFTLHGATLKFSTYSKVIRIGAICTHTEGLDFKIFLKELLKAKVKPSYSEQAELMNYFNEQKQKALELKVLIDKTDYDIDQMVYKLYDLSEEEIGIVEGL